MTAAAPVQVEICVDSVEGVETATAAGADRVELCSDLLEGGITPSLGLIATARAASPIRLHVLIRPRGGDFLFSRHEQAVMLHDIAAAKAAGVDGVVLGALDRAGDVDVELTTALIAAARPLPVTFHRAFDHGRDPLAALDCLLALGVDRLLTSGQRPAAIEGAALIARLVARAAGRLSVMPGGGIGADNVHALLQATRAREVHLTASATVASEARHRHPPVDLGSGAPLPDGLRRITSPAAVRAVVLACRDRTAQPPASRVLQ